MSILVRGGTVVTAEGTLDADVVVEGEKIAYLLPRNTNIGFTGIADEVVDATDMYVIPGGIDGHTHM